jgi:hypothetical protein
LAVLTDRDVVVEGLCSLRRRWVMANPFGERLEIMDATLEACTACDSVYRKVQI